MKKLIFRTTLKSSLISLALLAYQLNAGARIIRESASPLKNQSIKALSNLPLSFVINQGQWDSDIKFSTRVVGGGEVYFDEHGISYSLLFSKGSDIKNTDQYEACYYRLNFLGSNEGISVSGFDQRIGKINYLGQNQQYTSISTYSGILYNDIYDGIDLKYYGTGGKLKYDYILKPGADIKDIGFAYEGIEKTRINSMGQIEIRVGQGTLLEEVPYTYQIIEGIEREVRVRYKKLGDGRFGFEIVGSYDKTIELIIDPFTLLWGSFIGGTVGNVHEYLADIGVDAAGNIYATGKYSGDPPDYLYTTVGAFDEVGKAITSIQYDVFVQKISSDGTTLIYGTYLAGSLDDYGTSIAANSAGEAFISGYTFSTDFPVTPGSFQPSKAGGVDAFLAKLSADGTTLLYGTYYGGTGNDGSLGSERGVWVDVNSANEVIIAGTTNSGSSFPLSSGSYDDNYNTNGQKKNGGTSPYVVKFNGTTGARLYATFIPAGNGGDYVTGMVLNDAGEAYVCGKVWFLSDFTVTGYNYDAGTGRGAFVLKLNASGSDMLASASIPYGTYGSTSVNNGGELALSSTGEVLFAGYTDNVVTLPTTAGVFQPSFAGVYDGFVLKLSADFNTLMWCTYLGGAGNDVIQGLAVGPDNQVYLSGVTYSGFPVLAGDFQTTPVATTELFLSVLSSDASFLLCSTYIGGSSSDYRTARLSVDPLTGVVSCGLTSHSSDFPAITAGSFKTIHEVGGADQPTVFTMKCVLPLPITLVDFSAKIENQNVLLVWQTASESNNDYFVMESSFDGNVFSAIGQVKGEGNTTGINQYTFEDEKPLEGDNYYRLKQIDFDGQFSYSKTIVVKVSVNNTVVEYYMDLYGRKITHTKPLQPGVYIQKKGGQYQKVFILKTY